MFNIYLFSNQLPSLPFKKIKWTNKTNLVEIKGASIFSSIAWHMASSGIRTPTFFLAAYLEVAVPYLIHCLGNSLLAVRMKVYCCIEDLLGIKIIHLKSLRNLLNPKCIHTLSYANKQKTKKKKHRPCKFINLKTYLGLFTIMSLRL